MATDAIDTWYDHLDGCEQCREHRLDLCDVGNSLIVKATQKAKEIMDSMNSEMTDGKA